MHDKQKEPEPGEKPEKGLSDEEIEKVQGGRGAAWPNCRFGPCPPSFFAPLDGGKKEVDA